MFALWAFHHRAREEKPQFKPEDCPRESTDNSGSSRSTHRLWRKQCCSFIDELPTELRRERVALAQAVENTTLDKVSIIEATTQDDQDVLTRETVGRILGIFSRFIETECSSSPSPASMTLTRHHELLQEAAFKTRSCWSRTRSEMRLPS